MKKQATPAPSTLEVEMFCHCQKCVAELKGEAEPKSLVDAALIAHGISPKDYARVSVGFTKWGLQVWCTRHECNVVRIDYEGKSPFPANMDP